MVSWLKPRSGGTYCDKNLWGHGTVGEIEATTYQSWLGYADVWDAGRNNQILGFQQKRRRGALQVVSGKILFWVGLKLPWNRRKGTAW